MDKTLKYISISHKRASVVQREIYHIPEAERVVLIKEICKIFKDVTGLFILATCNRTEIYFESSITSALELRDFFIAYKVKVANQINVNHFKYSNLTEKTVKHLLDVASGLESSVIGDAEIIHQIKKAHQFSMANKLQGSLLERALQAVFKSHKRISNETNFRDGTTSVAYKSLKVIRNTFDNGNKKILFIGAGDIVKQLFKYNSKFNYSNIYLSNRTEEKALILSKNNQCKTYSWSKVLLNNFEDFDVIISAVSNCHHLINTVQNTSKKILLIDLAIPSNINKTLESYNNSVFYDLDSISIDLEETKEKRLAAIRNVSIIIKEEYNTFNLWLQTSAFRKDLARSKSNINKKIIDYLKSNNEKLNSDKIHNITNKVMRKLMSKPVSEIALNNIDTLIVSQL